MVVRSKQSGAGQAAVSRRALLLRAAARQFLNRGYAGTTLLHVTNEAGGSRRTIYQEFGDKSGLFAAVIDDLFRGTPDSKATRAFGLPPEQALLIFGRRLMHALMAPQSLALYRMLLGEVGRFPKLGRLAFQLAPQMASTRLAAYLREQTSLGTLDVRDPDSAAWAFLEMLQGDVHLRALLNPRQRISRKAVQKSVQTAVQLFLNGTRPRTTARGTARPLAEKQASPGDNAADLHPRSMNTPMTSKSGGQRRDEANHRRAYRRRLEAKT